ncbi:hypothetical protein GCM10011390_10410 [Aureimonas endophytica]|uniref:Uncharacterized protein n=1 Tax=Aureimonas endophytica TaxID=2027858 RepID=A0A916ZFC2_9HYPH|nr:hypothetical protein [Aureimonas endophytica]GGD93573.1 hypothetical protein GCM10011390_10410 [Aureimonas endophytica]
MIPAVPLLLRGILALNVMALALVLDASVGALDRLTMWIVPEAGRITTRRRRREP